MTLDFLEADRLRNLRAVAVQLPPGLTFLVGRNGQGKTSLVEAVYLLATGRSFRTRRTEEAISLGGGPLRVAGRVSGRLGLSRLAVVMDGQERRLVADGIETRLETYLGRLDVIALPAEWMGVLKGAPQERRRFLDRGIAGLDPPYVRELGEFREALLQRNAFLRGRHGKHRTGAELAAWDDRLVEAAARIHRRRREYATRLAAKIGGPERALFREEEGDLRLLYRPSPRVAAEEEPAAFREIYRGVLERTGTRDVTLGFTGEGPHRDDLVAELGGVDLRRFGSAGQVRSGMIALKLSKWLLLRERKADTPVFLMDDFDADLDEGRAARLATFLHGGGCQAILATSKESLASSLGVPFTKLRMEAGEAHAA